MAISNVADSTREEFQIDSLRESRKLRRVTDPGIDQLYHAVLFEQRKELLGRLSSEPNCVKRRFQNNDSMSGRTLSAASIRPATAAAFSTPDQSRLTIVLSGFDLAN